MIEAILVKISELILTKINKIVATRCQILRLQCTGFNSGWGSASDFAGKAYSAAPAPFAGFKGPTSKGRGGERRQWREKEKGPLYFFLRIFAHD